MWSLKWSAIIIQALMLNLTFAALTTRNSRGKRMMLHVNQYSTSHTEPAKAFDGFSAQWTVAKELVQYMLHEISQNMAQACQEIVEAGSERTNTAHSLLFQQ